MVGSINRAYSKYITSVLESCGSREEFIPLHHTRIPKENDYLKMLSTSKKKPPIEQIAVHVWNRLTRQKLEHLCTRINNFNFARQQIQWLQNEFKSKTQYKNEDDSIRKLYSEEEWETRFKPGKDSISQGHSQLMEYTATKLVFVDLRTPLIEELYVPSASKARLDRVLKLFDPVITTALKSFMNDDNVKREFLLWVLRSFIEALYFVLLYGGTLRFFEFNDAELFAEDILMLKDIFIGKRKLSGAGLSPILPEQAVIGFTDPLKRFVTNALALQTEVLISQFQQVPVLEQQNNESEITLLTKWNILSILIHRNDKEAKKFVKTMKPTPLYQHLKKGRKVELEDAITKGTLSLEAVTMEHAPVERNTSLKDILKLG